MTLEIMAFYSAFDDFETWRAALATEGIDLRQADDIADPGSERQALVWKPPHGFFARYPNLGLVVNLGADHLSPMNEPLFAPAPGAGWTLLWSSEDAAYDGGGVLPQPNRSDAAATQGGTSGRTNSQAIGGADPTE